MHHKLQQLSLNCFNCGISSLMKRKTLKTRVMLLLITEVGPTCRASCDYTPPPRQRKAFWKYSPFWGVATGSLRNRTALSLTCCLQCSPTFTPAWALSLPHALFLSFSSINAFYIAIATTLMFSNSKTPVSLIIQEYLQKIQSSRTHKLSFLHLINVQLCRTNRN